MLIDESAYLLHFGVRGMKWGVRNEDRSGGKSLLNKKMSDVSNRKGKVGELTPEAKLQFSVGVASIIGQLTYRAIDSGELHSLVTRGKRFIQGKKDSPWEKKPELAKPHMSSEMLMSKVVKDINKTGGIGSKGNCMRCSFAYEMRRRGYNVEATRTPDAMGQNTRGMYKTIYPRKMRKESPYKDFAKDSKYGRVKSSPDTIFKDLAKQPNGARGITNFQWKHGGGHSLAWEIVNGKPILFDGQNNRMYKDAKAFSVHSRKASQMGYTRLDNVPLNQTMLMRWLKDA